MLILAINCGSSSLKGSLIDSDTGRRLFDQLIENDGDHGSAVHRLLDELRQPGDNKPAGVAHRIVHGGDRFVVPTLVTDEVLDALSVLNGLAPLHNPPAVAALRVARQSLPAIPHVAVFDTSFHSTLPLPAYQYALPAEVRRRFGIRRYGFHGISHAHVMDCVAAHSGRAARELRIISCHLGNGASVAAIEYGRSVETSMGMTPLEGLVMGTRSGDIDPGVLVHLLHTGEYDADQLDVLLNHESGLQGLTGTNDLRLIESRAAAGDEACADAIEIYAHRVTKTIGAYVAVMGGVDVIAFTGGIGEHSALMRHRSLRRLEFLGVELDDALNRDAEVDRAEADRDRATAGPIASISSARSRVAVVVVKADEEGRMAREAAGLIAATASS